MMECVCSLPSMTLKIQSHIADAFAEIAGRAIDAGISALEDVMTQKVIPAVKRKGTELINKVKHVQTEKKNKKTHESSALATK